MEESHALMVWQRVVWHNNLQSLQSTPTPILFRLYRLLRVDAVKLYDDYSLYSPPRNEYLWAFALFSKKHAGKEIIKHSLFRIKM